MYVYLNMPWAKAEAEAQAAAEETRRKEAEQKAKAKAEAAAKAKAPAVDFTTLRGEIRGVSIYLHVDLSQSGAVPVCSNRSYLIVYSQSDLWMYVT